MKILKYTLSILVLVALIAGIAYGVGLRFYEGRIVRAASLTIELPVQAGALFLDGERISFAQGQESVVFRRVTPGEHVVIYGGDTILPWQRIVTLLPSEKRVLKPFVSPSNTQGFFINEGDEEHADIRASFKEDGTVDESGALLSDDGTTALWVIGDTVFLDWLGETENIPAFFCSEAGDVCDVRLPFFTSIEGPIQYATFYKDRSDVIVIASGEKVFAIDGLINDFRNFQPLYIGTAIDARKKNNDELYIRDAVDGKEQFLIIQY